MSIANANAPAPKNVYWKVEIYKSDHRKGAPLDPIWNKYERRREVPYADDQHTERHSTKKPSRAFAIHLPGKCGLRLSGNIDTLYNHHTNCPHTSTADRNNATKQKRERKKLRAKRKQSRVSGHAADSEDDSVHSSSHSSSGHRGQGFSGRERGRNRSRSRSRDRNRNFGESSHRTMRV